MSISPAPDPAEGPVLVFDDDCGFCTRAAEFVAARSAIRLVGFSQLTPELRDRLPPDYESCSHLLVDGERYSCGASMEESFARTDVGAPVADALRFLRNFREYELLREYGYSVVTDNRSVAGRVVGGEPARARRERERDEEAHERDDEEAREREDEGDAEDA